MIAILIPVVGLLALVMLQYGARKEGRFIWPLRKGEYSKGWNDGTSHFGYRPSKSGGKVFHAGLDIGAPQGTDVLAIGDAVVLRVIHNHSGAGTYMELEQTGDGAGVFTRYLHLSHPYVKKGDRVVKGQVIALSGGQPGLPSSGTSYSPHLHFETWDADPSKNWSRRTEHWFDPLTVVNE